MGRTKRYEYHGELQTLAELSKVAKVDPSVIYKRINLGWDIEMAVETPSESELKDLIPDEYKFKDLEVCFTHPIYSVFAHMQPRLNRKYIAKFPQRARIYESSKPYYIIDLEERGKLIVYPGEFEILSALDAVVAPAGA